MYVCTIFLYLILFVADTHTIHYQYSNKIRIKFKATDKKAK